MPMPLLDGFEPARGGMACTLQATLNRLPADEAAELIAYLFSPEWFTVVTAGQIERALLARRISFSRHTVGNHRRGECATCRLSKPQPPPLKD
jgi:hypothetical protein